jgi:hypothetical protein
VSTSTLTRTPDPGDDFDRIIEGYDEPPRSRIVKSRTEIMTVQDAINTSMGRRRHRTREQEA